MSTPKKYKSGFDYDKIMDDQLTTKKMKVEKIVRRKANVFQSLDDLVKDYFFTTKEGKAVVRDWLNDRDSDYDSPDTDEEGEEDLEEGEEGELSETDSCCEDKSKKN